MPVIGCNLMTGIIFVPDASVPLQTAAVRIKIKANGHEGEGNLWEKLEYIKNLLNFHENSSLHCGNTGTMVYYP